MSPIPIVAHVVERIPDNHRNGIKPRQTRESDMRHAPSLDSVDALERPDRSPLAMPMDKPALGIIRCGLGSANRALADVSMHARAGVGDTESGC